MGIGRVQIFGDRAKCMERPRLVPATFGPFQDFPDWRLSPRDHSPTSLLPLCRPGGRRRPLATARFLCTSAVNNTNDLSPSSPIHPRQRRRLSGASAFSHHSTPRAHRDRSWHLVLRHLICEPGVFFLPRGPRAVHPTFVTQRFVTPCPRPRFDLRLPPLPSHDHGVSSTTADERTTPPPLNTSTPPKVCPTQSRHS